MFNKTTKKHDWYVLGRAKESDLVARQELNLFEFFSFNLGRIKSFILINIFYSTEKFYLESSPKNQCSARNALPC